MGYIIGINPALTQPNLTDGKGFGLGDLGTDAAGNVYRYVQAAGAITGQGYVVIIDEAFQAAMVTTSNDALGDQVGVAQTAFADDEYGWVMVYGYTQIRSEQDALANSYLGATSDAGQIDDAAATGLYIRDMILTTARGGTDGLAPGFVNWPTFDTRPAAAQ